jgi:hypothetical protein
VVVPHFSKRLPLTLYETKRLLPDVKCFSRFCGCFKKSIQSIQIAANFRVRAFLFSRPSIPVSYRVPSHAILLSAPLDKTSRSEIGGARTRACEQFPLLGYAVRLRLTGNLANQQCSFRSFLISYSLKRRSWFLLPRRTLIIIDGRCIDSQSAPKGRCGR